MNIISYILKTIRQPNLQYVLEEVQMCFESSYYDMHLYKVYFHFLVSWQRNYIKDDAL